jgi:hypothetical protein
MPFGRTTTFFTGRASECYAPLSYDVNFKPTTLFLTLRPSPPIVEILFELVAAF